VTGPKYLDEALAEYEDAVVYYERREEGLGARLIEEFDEAVTLALEYPEAFAAHRMTGRLPARDGAYYAPVAHGGFDLQARGSIGGSKVPRCDLARLDN
jgi:hypothetical protein